MNNNNEITGTRGGAVVEWPILGSSVHSGLAVQRLTLFSDGLAEQGPLHHQGYLEVGGNQ